MKSIISSLILLVFTFETCFAGSAEQSAWAQVFSAMNDAEQSLDQLESQPELLHAAVGSDKKWRVRFYEKLGTKGKKKYRREIEKTIERLSDEEVSDSVSKTESAPVGMTQEGMRTWLVEQAMLGYEASIIPEIKKRAEAARSPMDLVRSLKKEIREHKKTEASHAKTSLNRKPASEGEWGWALIILMLLLPIVLVLGGVALLVVGIVMPHLLILSFLGVGAGVGGVFLWKSCWE